MSILFLILKAKGGTIMICHCNKAELRGTLVGIKYLYSKGSENFYHAYCLARNETHENLIPLLLSDKLWDTKVQIQHLENTRVRISGFVASNDVHYEKKHKLNVCIKVNKISFDIDISRDKNRITLIGTICKKPYLVTCKSGAIIANFIIAINKEEMNDNYYIPCISLSDASIISECNIGTVLVINGRFHSRNYEKDNTCQKAYEISAKECKILV